MFLESDQLLLLYFSFYSSLCCFSLFKLKKDLKSLLTAFSSVSNKQWQRISFFPLSSSSLLFPVNSQKNNKTHKKFNSTTISNFQLQKSTPNYKSCVPLFFCRPENSAIRKLCVIKSLFLFSVLIPFLFIFFAKTMWKPSRTLIQHKFQCHL